ncbi:MAG TPA: metal-binding protein [Gammaproteobacteria bacterium]|nr:metal-binding protein [Gammaproteobacteria bacterium]
MLDRLPVQVEPLGLCDAGRAFRGVVAVEVLERLAPLLARREGELRVELGFGLDERRIRVVEGRVSGELRLLCQRCLKALTFPVDLAFRLGVVLHDAEAQRLPEGYEPLLADGEPLPSSRIVEDELLLAIPPVPLHGAGEGCRIEHVNQPAPERENPFAVLEKLKR